MKQRRKKHEISRRLHLIEEYQSDVDQFFIDVWKCDPTNNGSYTNWIVSGILKENFKLHDHQTINKLLSTFTAIKPRLKRTGKSSDINAYSYADLCYLIDELVDPDVSFSYSSVDDVVVHYDGEHGTLVTPLTMEASIKLGSGTKWCSSAKNENQFHIYDDSPLYIWIESSGKYQFHFTTPEAANHHNIHLTKDEIDYFRNEHPVIRKLFHHQEEILMQSPRNSYFHAAKMIFERFEEAEPVIAKSPTWAYFYARDVLHDRFVIAEKKIRSSMTYKRLYDQMFA